ncbi:MAG: class C sortase [Ruminococcus sp.]|nr:class C sortase [Ruminococcus sp.]
MKKKIILVILIIINLTGISLLLYPAISNFINTVTNKSTAESYHNKVNLLSDDNIDDLLSEAIQYNEFVAKRYYTDESKSTYDIYNNYNNIFNFGDGLICYIEIPKINIYIPVYHDSENNDITLQKGAIHLRQSSLPIGGDNTRSIISAHSGYPAQKFFDDIDELDNGDSIIIHILNKTIEYEVISSEVIEPQEIENVKVKENEDMLTLITCYPYGINSHRLLVNAVRSNNIKNTTLDTNKKNKADALIKNDFKATYILIPIIIIVLVILIFRKVKANDRNKSKSTVKK